MKDWAGYENISPIEPYVIIYHDKYTYYNYGEFSLNTGSIIINFKDGSKNIITNLIRLSGSEGTFTAEVPIPTGYSEKVISEIIINGITYFIDAYTDNKRLSTGNVYIVDHNIENKIYNIGKNPPARLVPDFETTLGYGMNIVMLNTALG